MRRFSGREQVLLLGAFAVAVAMGFFLFRVRPHRDRMDKLAFQTQWTRQRLDGVVWPEDKGDPAQLERELGTLQQATAAAGARLRAIESRFVSLGRPGARDELRLEISALADRHGVRFCETMSCPRTTLRQFLGDTAGRRERDEAADLVCCLALGEPYELELQQVTLEASFLGLFRFLSDLNRLEQRVIVLRFQVEVRARSDGLPLRARLLVVM